MIYKLAAQVKTILGRADIHFEVIKWIEEWQRKSLTEPGDYLEFGCGQSTINFYKALRKIYRTNLPKEYFHMWLFDTFKGLPKATQLTDKHPVWKVGTFDLGGQKNFKDKLLKNQLPIDRFTIIAGDYKNTLKKFDKKKIKRAAFIYMDCDYYSSTKCALNFCKDLLQNFTVIYFDDLYSFAGNPNKGQLLAISEFNKENKNVGLVHCPILDYVAPGRFWWFWTNQI